MILNSTATLGQDKGTEIPGCHRKGDDDPLGNGEATEVTLLCVHNSPHLLTTLQGRRGRQAQQGNRTPGPHV